jgi:predicted ATP-grasp superfamily ATP-dependent carboligase
MYFQQRVHGPSCAALFVGDSRRGTLIGLTRQLVGEQSFHARPFHYCGSIGPLPLEDRLQRQLIRLGDVLVAEFGLIGLFGVDGVLVDGEFWPVEVNPRYTASAEVLEFALGLPLMALQRDACANRTLSLNAADRLAESGRVIVGKAILFAARVTSVPDLSPELCRPLDNSAARWPIPRIADVPFEGEQIAAGRPICTVFAIHSGLDACHAALTHAARSVYCQFELSRSHAAR